MGANPLRVSLLLLFLSQSMLSADLVMVEGRHGLEDMKNDGLLHLVKYLEDVPAQQENTFETGPGMSRARRGEEMSGDQPGYTGYSSRIMRSPLKSGKIMLN